MILKIYLFNLFIPKYFTHNVLYVIVIIYNETTKSKQPCKGDTAQKKNNETTTEFKMNLEYTMTNNNDEIVVIENGKVIAKMIDLRDINMGIAPHWISTNYSELSIVEIIFLLERIEQC